MMRAMLLLFFLAGCAGTGLDTIGDGEFGYRHDITQPGVCKAHGVIEQGRTMGRVIESHGLDFHSLRYVCPLPMEPDKVNVDCLKQVPGGVEVFYLEGDACALDHALCHAQEGTLHTPEYWRRLRANELRPYCPEIGWTSE